MHIRDFLRRTAALVTAAGLLGLAGAAHAAYPEQPIKLVVGFPPGGGGDLYGRTIANALAKHIGQAVQSRLHARQAVVQVMRAAVGRHECDGQVQALGFDAFGALLFRSPGAGGAVCLLGA